MCMHGLHFLFGKQLCAVFGRARDVPLDDSDVGRVIKWERWAITGT